MKGDLLSCSISEPGTCVSVGGLEIGVGGGDGVGILPRSNLKGLVAVREQVGACWSPDSDLVPTENDSKFVASEVPGVGGSWLGSAWFTVVGWGVEAGAMMLRERFPLM